MSTTTSFGVIETPNVGTHAEQAEGSQNKLDRDNVHLLYIKKYQLRLVYHIFRSDSSEGGLTAAEKPWSGFLLQCG